MFGGVKLLVVLALVLACESKPKKYHNLPYKSTIGKTPTATLDTNVKPSHYQLYIELTEDGLNRDATFSGKVDITIQADTQTDVIKLHVKDLTIAQADIEIVEANGDGSNKVPVKSYAKPEPTAKDDIATITTDSKLKAKTDYILSIKLYTGLLSDTDMEGFYRSSYLDSDGKTKYLATTQFEEMGARRAFPCFDEPQFKASFQISVRVPTGMKAMSNTKGTTSGTDKLKDENLYIFEKTPKMSTYLVAFIVSEFENTDSKQDKDNIDTRVWGRPGTKKYMTVASDTAPKALNAMKDFTSIAYKDMTVGKLDQAAIPDFAAGAMENWGMLTYREADLLWDQDQSSNYYQQAVVTVSTHEISHQWFGDYVTLDSWDNIFLNEGFATFFEYYAADKIQTDWELLKQFVVEQLQTALVSDSSADSLPLSYSSTDPEEIESRFDVISYNKGGSVIRMLRYFIGEAQFIDGLKTYLTANKYDNGGVSKLWSSFKDDATNQKLPDSINVEEIMDNWTKKAGYPVLTVEVSKDNAINLTVTQKRFLPKGVEDKDNTKWYVPITYATKTDNDSSKTDPQDWLKPDADVTITLENKDDWILLNNQQVGYYRVSYSDDLLKRIQTVLKNKDTMTKIDVIARSTLIDDQINLARAGYKTYLDVLKFLEFMINDDSYYSWYPAFNGFAYLLKRTNDDKVKTSLKSYLKENMKALLTAVPIDSEKSKQIEVLNQVLANTWACKVNEEKCLAKSKELFDAYVADKTKTVNPNLRSIVYCNGLRQSKDGNEAKTNFDFLSDQYTASPLATERVTILKALGCVNNSTLRRSYLEKSLTDEVRIQDVSYVFSSVYSNNDADGVNDVLDFIKDKYKDFKTRFGDDSQLISLIGTVADLITDQKQIDIQLAALIEIDDLKDVATKANATATANLKEIDDLQTKLKAYFDQSNDNSAAITSYHFVNSVFMLVAYLVCQYY